MLDGGAWVEGCCAHTGTPMADARISTAAWRGSDFVMPLMFVIF
jgi:hypothetical protein